MVPLSDSLLYADLIAQLNFGLIIVAPNVLGTINATLLTIEAARSRGIEVLGVVLNQTPESDFGNADAIAHFGKVPIIGEFPTVVLNDDLLADTAEQRLDLDTLLVD